MTIPLFNDYKRLCPQWTRNNQDDLIRKTFRFNGKQYDIGDPACCKVGEIYCGNNAYVDECDACDKFAYFFFDLIDNIPSYCGIKWWTSAKSEWKNNVITMLEEGEGLVTEERAKAILEMLKYYDAAIENYRDLYNCFANNYVQHLAQCECYANNVAIIR
jgi:hypothetical protein